jgi:hypothetical protein
MSEFSASDFAIQAMTAEEWLILDHAYPRDDARHIVAYLQRVGADDVEAVWVRTLALPGHYRSVAEALKTARSLHSTVCRTELVSAR